MAKKKGVKPQREVTKRQLSRWQQEKRRQRITLISGISVILTVLVVLGVGWYLSDYQPLHQTVIMVNDAEFNMDYYVKALKYYGLSDEVVEIVQQNELVRQEAMKLGISVSDDEVDEELNSFDPPLSKDYRDLKRAEMLLMKLRDEYFEQEVPLFAEQRHIMAMLLESKSQANEITARLEGSDNFSALAGEFSLESYSKAQSGDLGWHPEGIFTALLGTPIPDDYAFSHEAGVLSQPIYDDNITKPVGYWLIRVWSRENEGTEGEAILLGSEEEAQEIRDRLEAGEDFETLAKEFSQDELSKEDGGNLGFVRPGEITPAFEEFFFNPDVELETLSQPIRDENVITKGGYWLAEVVSIEDNRQIEDNDRNYFKSKALSEWVSALWDNPENKVESYLDDEMNIWAIQQAMK